MGIKKYETICDNCKKKFLIDSSTYYKLQDGRQKHCYCSKECKKNSQMNGKYILCKCCGKLIYRTTYRQNKTMNNFCSIQCDNKYKHDIAYEIRECKICGINFKCSKKSAQKFCSKNCQNKWQSTQIGELSTHYKRKSYNCDYCGKEFKVSMYKLKNKENGKTKNLFCSNICRRKWFTEITSQDEEQKEIHREHILKSLGNYSNLNTKPQQIIDKLLDEMNIKYVREYGTKYYSVDNYLPDYNLMIEIMGDYWHFNFSKYNKIQYDIQKNNVHRDKAKHTYIRKHYNIEILYLWEYDIYNNIDSCKQMILDYIEKSGNLDNYHSFNYKKESYIQTPY